MPTYTGKKHQYAALSDEEVDGLTAAQLYRSNPHRWSQGIALLGLLMALMLSALGGFYLGKIHYSQGTRRAPDIDTPPLICTYPAEMFRITCLLLTVNSVTRKFTSNRAFLHHPSKETEDLLENAIPERYS